MESVNEIIAEGSRLLQAGDVPAAVTKLRSGSDTYPNEAKLRSLLGIALCRAGDSGGGLASLQSASLLAPNDASIFYNLSVALISVGRRDEAKEALLSAQRIDPADTKVNSALNALGVTSFSSQATPPTPVNPPSNSAASFDMPGNLGANITPLVNPPPPQPQSPQPLYSAPAPQSQSPQPLYTAPQPQPLNPQSPYTAQPPPSGAPLPYGTPGGPGSPGGPGMVAPVPMKDNLQHPSTGLRVARGIGWGILFGQIWTVLFCFWEFFWGATKNGGSFSLPIIIITVILVGIVMGIVGAGVGLTIALTDASVAVGAAIGVGGGMLLMACEFLLSQSASALFNIIFWFFTGRYVGALTADRIRRPVVK